MTALNVLFRPATADDAKFVFAAIAHTYDNPRGASYYAQLWMRSGLYSITHILEAGIGDDKTSIGFITANKDILVFAYIKPLYRQMGLSKLLLKQVGLDDPHRRKRYSIRRGNYLYLTKTKNWVIDALSPIDAITDLSKKLPQHKGNPAAHNAKEYRGDFE